MMRNPQCVHVNKESLPESFWIILINHYRPWLDHSWIRQIAAVTVKKSRRLLQTHHLSKQVCSKHTIQRNAYYILNKLQKPVLELFCTVFYSIRQSCKLFFIAKFQATTKITKSRNSKSTYITKKKKENFAKIISKLKNIFLFEKHINIYMIEATLFNEELSV